MSREFERLELARMLAALPGERAVAAVALLLVGQVLRIVGIIAVSFATLLMPITDVISSRRCALVRTIGEMSVAVIGRTALVAVVLVHALDAAVLSVLGADGGGAAWR
ncbi:hypothetical protein [Actinocorallia longicatena]|uniref:Uncharacterized protein n=1 Tax=Actinocorallia longicatena TaxID=111803 RepID=A0ABP6QMW6_9ACTN